VDLVTCTGCKHVFSPTPGQRVRCPACMRFLDPPVAKLATVAKVAKAAKTATVVRPASAPPVAVRRPLKETTPTQPARSSRLPAIMLVAVVVLIGGAIWFLTRPKPTDPTTELAEMPKRPKLVLPDVVDPEVPRRPERKGDVPPPPLPPPLPIISDEPVKPKVIPKARPIDVASLPEVESPEFKTHRFEIKQIAGVDPDKVNAAIQRGVAYLQRSSPEWTASPQWPLGVPALCGLALLECDVPATDPLLQQVANQVRTQSVNELATYELSLAILFLDRFRQPRDRGLIQTLAARLIAAQDRSGSWDYRCRELLTQQETVTLLSILQQNRLVLARPLVPLTIGAEETPEKGGGKRGRDSFTDPFADSASDPTGSEIGPRRGGKEDSGPAAKTSAEDRPQAPRILPRSRMSGQPLPLVSTTPTPLPAAGITQRLQDVPTVKQRDRSRASLEIDFNNTVNDLSNTQFAILALWAARRHGVVSDRALLLCELRLRKTQLSSGSWNYKENGGSADSAMTCCGLLGLGLGTAADQPHGASLAQALKTDPGIQRAFDHLGAETGDPLPDVGAVGKMLSTYTLWSTERVAMMYRQKTIRGKDWYGWGAQNLLKHQDAAGSWLEPDGRSHLAPVDTSLALLFLVRSNLVQEISEQIRLQMPIQEK
jgi:hypothetical protein